MPSAKYGRRGAAGKEQRGASPGKPSHLLLEETPHLRSLWLLCCPDPRKLPETRQFYQFPNVLEMESL